MRTKSARRLELVEKIITELRRANHYRVTKVPLRQIRDILGVDPKDRNESDLFRKAAEDVSNHPDNRTWELRNGSFIKKNSAASKATLEAVRAVEVLSRYENFAPYELRERLKAAAFEMLMADLESILEPMVDQLLEGLLAGLKGNLEALKPKLMPKKEAEF